ncbi:MAG: VWA domain-containing protein, partial [Acidobacteriota bacterium]|nr:VWA domain-containing protein [Acidobacteriota bacterium]
MKKALFSLLCSALTFAVVLAQAPQRTPPPTDDEVIRISAELVQVDAVVTDKNDRIIDDLKLEDFEVYESGKKQELKFMEFVSVDAERRSEGARPPLVAEVETDTSRDLTGAELKRVIAFVVDDLTIPYEDMISVRRVLTDFVENKMRDGDLVAILRSVGGKGLLQQFTADRQLLRRAIASLTPRTNPFSAFNADSGRMNNLPTPTGGTADPGAFNEALAVVDNSLDAEGVGSGLDITNENDDTNRTFRALM